MVAGYLLLATALVTGVGLRVKSRRAKVWCLTVAWVLWGVAIAVTLALGA